MTDPTLERIWKSRKAIAERCDFDSKKLVKYIQERKKRHDRIKESKHFRSSTTDS